MTPTSAVTTECRRGFARRYGIYIPAVILLLGALLGWRLGTPQPTPLAQPLDQSIPMEILGFQGVEVPIAADEELRSGVSEYLNRAYDIGGEEGPMLFYLGYHATQQGEHRMHSPSVCLPGAGWTPVSSRMVSVPLASGNVTVNRYVLQKDAYRILVYYWFQGRGRVTAGEAELKVQTLMDALFMGRDEEALVRVVIPLPQGDESRMAIGSTQLPADSLATKFAAELIPLVEGALPTI